MQFKKGFDVTCENDSFEELAIRWKNLEKLEVLHNRYLTYECNLNKYESIFAYKITKVKAADIQEIILNGASSGLAYKTLLEIKGIAKQIFDLAIENRILDFNPAVSIKTPKIPVKSERRALTEDERTWIQE
ncbi:MAG: hypothetical protein VB100_10390 [Angelakisella sp.]|nr:hypothetical protein [Angelakisella sp.]